jgi:aspartate aminotransferase/aromatic-amino-acid transaminase
MFKGLEAAPADAILGLTEAYKADTNPQKINLGVGIYKDDEGVTPVLKSVKQAEERLLTSEKTKSYLPINGSPVYAGHVQALIFGDESTVLADNRARTVHTPGGTGALRMAADLVVRLGASRNVWVSDPTWANHKGIFQAAGFEINTYPYYNAESKGVDFDRMLEGLAKVPAGDLVVLHVCCHNPTGVDLDVEQWKQVAETAAAQGWIPLLDFAYQGFASGLVEDRIAVELLAGALEEFFVASSFSKNFGLYRERTGALTVVAANACDADAMFSHLKKTIRVCYSNPPAHGGMIVETVLGDEGLRAAWVDELASMRERIAGVRKTFVERLRELGVPRDFSFIERQNGMFSFSALSPGQIQFLRDEKGIYIVKGGRINVAGITSKNIEYLCASIDEALKL